MDSKIGSARFASMATDPQSHVTRRYATKTCHLCVTKSGWNRLYIDTIWAATICAVAASPKIQARKFHQPAKKPQMRP